MSGPGDVLNLPPQGGEFAVALDAFHLLVIGISFAGSFAVAIMALIWAIRYRRGSGRHRPDSRTPMWIEVLLALGLTALFLGWWALGWRVLHAAPAAAADEVLDIQVIAKQWMWTFIYPDGRQTIDELVLPVDRPVRLHLTSRDVIHSLYLPAFRRKHDALPQRTTRMDLQPRRPGTYHLFCAEYCGLSHSDMTGVVRVLDAAGWAAWLDRRPAGDDLVARGRLAAIRHGCLACHTTDGSPHIGPSWRGRLGKRVPLADGGSVVVDGPYLTRSMMDPRAEIAAGFRDLMPSYRDRLDPVDAAAIVAYIAAIDAGELDGQDSGDTPLPIPAMEDWW